MAPNFRGEFLIILSVFLPIALAGAPIAIVALLTYHRRQIHLRELGAQLIQEMLQRKLTVDEIERVFAAWTHDRRLAKRILSNVRSHKAVSNGGKPPAL